MKRVLFLVNHEIVIYNFRLELVEKLLEFGIEVYISSPYGERIEELINIGCKYEKVILSRHGKNPVNELKLVRYYISLINRVRPDVICTYTIKPNIYGGFVAAHCGVPYIVNITGLGTAIEAGGLKSKVLIYLYKKAVRQAERVFFQNKSNKEFMERQGIKAKKIELLPGSGVNLKRHSYEKYPENDENCRFLFVGRLMQDKGVTELLDAAKKIQKRHSDVSFWLVGDCEIEYKKILDEMNVPENVTLFGSQRDVHSYMKQANAIILPSYHEGMANVLLEAAACGRPVLASDIPGCRETFEEGISGYGFKARDVESLVNAIEKFLSLDRQKWQKMGIAGRQKMEREFNRSIVVDAYMEIIQNL